MGSVTVLIVLLAAVAVYGSPNRSLATRKSTFLSNSKRLGIHNGKNTTIEKHPYLVDLHASGSPFCAGTILGYNSVLTSGDCVDGFSVDALTVLAGSKDASSGTIYLVDKIIVHPKHGKTRFQYDFAIIKIKGKFKWNEKVQWANVTQACHRPNTLLRTAGYGMADEKERDELNEVLQEGDMKLQSQKFCKSVYEGYGLEWSNTMSCVYNKGNTTLCHGDWANAFYTPPKNGDKHINVEHIFIGVATDDMCTDRAKPCICGNVCSVASWVKKIVGE